MGAQIKGTKLRKAAAAACCMAAAGFFRSEYEKNHFAVETAEVFSPKIRGEKSLVFLTDLHDKEFGEGNVRLLRAIFRERPDGILIGGDMMVSKGKGDLDVTLSLLRSLAGAAPVFYSLGNHEMRLRNEKERYPGKFGFLMQEAKKLGVRMLADATQALDELDISGVDLSPSCYKKLFLEQPARMPEGYLERKLGKRSRDRFRILLMHSPLYFKEAADWGADLTLSGHFHGGTVRIPFAGGLMTPQYQFFVPWCAGSFERDGKQMIVGRGLGTHSVNIRLNDRPQLLIIRLKPGKKEK